MKDGWYWVRFREAEKPWLIANKTGASIIVDRYSLPVDLFEMGDYIETPEKYR